MFIKSTKLLAACAVMTAVLIAMQLAFSAVKGVELVTALFICFCFVFGAIPGVTVAVTFSLLRCLLFGFFPTVVILYLVYYPLLAVAVGLTGKRSAGAKRSIKLIVVCAEALVFTALFTLLDDAITPLFFGYSRDAALAYFYLSLPVMLGQCVCAVISSALLFVPITRAFLLIRI